MFVDFAGDTVPVTDPDTGGVWDKKRSADRVAVTRRLDSVY
jgi:hypothetical protein